MTTRRAELPSLNMVITRSIPYETAMGSFGPVEDVIERKTRARVLVASPSNRLRVSNPDFHDKQIRSFLVRPTRETFTYTWINEPRMTTEERTISLAWGEPTTVSGDNTFRDSMGIKWNVEGVGFYDSAGRMLEILASYATNQR